MKTMTNNDSRQPRTVLHDARVECGWSQQKLADLIGTTKVAISRWESGTVSPSPYYRQRLSDVLGKTPAELGLLPPSSDSRRTPAKLVLLPPQPPVARIWNIPIARTPFFTGREHLLELLHKRLLTAKTAALTHPQALYGLGGIGKTRAAAEYAFRYGDDYSHVFWMRAATRDTLLADLVALARHLDLPEKDEADQPRIVAAVQRWLADHEGWLLILDNADDLLLALEFLPANHKGYVLFTTRAQAAGAIAASVEVEKLSVQEGMLLLLRWSRILDVDIPLDSVQAADGAAAERIVKEMDGLPLAIVQAGAFVQETGCSLADYLDLYATYRKELLARSSRLILDHPETVAATWSLSFQQIERTNPAAADVLRFCAFLAADAIPEELLTRGATELSAAFAAVAADALQLNETLGVLLRYSLIQRHADTHMLSIHRLVQTVLRESMDQQTQCAWAGRTVRAINVAFPEADYGVGADHQYYLRYYLPHIRECATLIERYHLHFPEAAQLLYQAGAFLFFHGFQLQSQLLHGQALAIREKTLGLEHAATAESLNNLGVLYRTLGDYEQAEKFHQQALAIRKKALGPRHPATAESLNNLGVLYRTLGKYEQAEPLLQQALSIREQSLSSGHPDTLYSFFNLAKLYTEQYNYEQAEQLLNQALAIGERALKPEHPLIAHNLNLLARLSYEQGNYERAETLWKRSLAIYEKTLGPEHPATAGLLNDLAELYAAQGHYAEAQTLCQRALSVGEKRLGVEHPDTIIYREHLLRIVSKRERKQDDYHPASPPH
ncbi:MAG TPA: tetratricopeptide repeat protein [Ktedonobacteraceae bacterium]|nr:tetratricopeptide repeat protein [Ktedonobacteraceae bacterium]